MVREQRGRSYSSSDDSSDSDQRRKRKKQRGKSLQVDRRDRHRDVDVKPRIKREPSSDSDSSSNSFVEQKPVVKRERLDRQRDERIKGERRHDSTEEHGRRRHRERDHLAVRIKQEPDSEEEMRLQREERQRNDERRIEKRRRQDREERREHEQQRRDGRRNDRRDDARRNDERRDNEHGNRGRRGGRDNRNERNDISEDQRYGRREDQASNSQAEPQQPKDAPDFKLSGKLTEDTNTYKGVVIKYNEPPEARKPKKRWRLYPFKNDEPLKPFHMHRQSAYLFGRDRLIADIPVDHPSCSKQHAVFQYRMVPYEKPDGRRAYKIAPYIIDLESANGTFVNNKRIDDRVYVELLEKDVIKFGFSSREYVLLHDKSDTKEVESDMSD